MSDTMLSILTLYKWNETLFDDMQIPPELDKETLVENLVIELAEFSVLYPDWDFMKMAIKQWSKKEIGKWTKLYATTILDYNPIENYNRTEESTDTETRDLDKSNTETRNLNATNLQTRNLATTGSDNTVVDGEINKSGSDENLTSVSAFNDQANLTDSEKLKTTLGTKEETDSTVNVTVNTSDTGTVNNAISDTGTVTRSEEDNGTVTTGRTSNIKGNIGVTTTQQMIEQERMSVQFVLYDYIINSFKLRFCITKY